MKPAKANCQPHSTKSAKRIASNPSIAEPPRMYRNFFLFSPKEAQNF